MEQQLGDDPAFSSVGGRLCLDFVNTVVHRLARDKYEALHTFNDLVRWGVYSQIIGRDAAGELVRNAAGTPQEADFAFRSAIELREASFNIFYELCNSNDPKESDLATLKTAYGLSISEMNLNFTTGRGEWTVAKESPSLELISCAVAQSVVGVLTSGEYKRVRQCPGISDCGYLFYDASKNGTRRWCSMDNCGSRAKMRALYARRNYRNASSEY